MSAPETERARLALVAIQQAYGSEFGKDSIDLFVEHHIDELPGSYWQQHLGRSTPEPAAVIGLLQLRSSWGESDIENFDFSLPGDVTDYVVTVHFDNDGKIDAISMES
jgi:hypothetical protein